MRFAKGDNKHYAPKFVISLLLSLRVRLEKLRKFAKEDNRDYAPLSPM